MTGEREQEPRNRRLEIRIALEEEMAMRFHTVKKRYGFENNTDVVRFLITKAYDITIKRTRLPTEPRIQYMNTIGDHIALRDLEKDKVFNVYFRETEVWCELCESSSCVHVGFTYAIPKALKILQEKEMSSKDSSSPTSSK